MSQAAPTKRKASSPTSQLNQPVASGSGSSSGTTRKAKAPKIVKSKDPGFDYEAEGGDVNEDDIKNKYKLGEETASGKETFIYLLLNRGS